MAGDLDTPIALRRSRRTSEKLPSNISETAAPPATPGRKARGAKRVRFSDPGPVATIPKTATSSTGLTPMVRRTCLSQPSPRRRHSTPSSLGRSPASGSGLVDFDAPSSPFSGTVEFLPLRQVLDGRVKRRIRRNGLSEEMHAIHASKKRRADAAQAEITRLQAALADKDDEIERLQDETHVYDTERVWELEQQVSALKQQLADRVGRQMSSSPIFGRAGGAASPFDEDMMDFDMGDADHFGQSTMADLVCSTPSRRARASFPTPPTTSPAAEPMSPDSLCQTPHAHSAVQANLPDLEKQGLEDELASLQLEMCKLTTVLEGYTDMAGRLSDKLGPFKQEDEVLTSASTSSPHPDIEAHLNQLLQSLSDRTAALVELSSSLSGLGFPGADACDIITSISSAFRTARLELEYLTPGEVPLPLTSAGAAVLDLLLNALRDLSRKSREADETIDEYHSIEQSLRQQLGARVDAMDGMTADMKRLEQEAKDKEAHIAELEVGLERLKGAVKGYTRDVTELESLVQKMEGELEESARSRKGEKKAAEKASKQHAAELATKVSAIADLETKLNTAVEQTTSLQQQLASLQDAQTQALHSQQTRHKADVAKLSRSQGQALALRDARVSELRGEIDRINASLRAAYGTVQQLRVDNGQLQERNNQLAADNASLQTERAADRRTAKEVIDSMKAELERVVRLSEGLAGPPKQSQAIATPLKRRSTGLKEEQDATPRVLRSGERPAGSKRRRYDSGLGFLDEEEMDV